MTSRSARHDLDSAEVDCAPPLLCLYHVLYRLEQEGRPLPVRIPYTVLIDHYFIRAAFTMEARVPRADEPKFPPPMSIVKRPVSSLNAHIILQELVECDWRPSGSGPSRDDLSDDEIDLKKQREAAAAQAQGGGGPSAAARLAAARMAALRAERGRSGFAAAGVVVGSGSGGGASRGRGGRATAGDGDSDDETAHYGHSVAQQALNSRKKFRMSDVRRACIWAEATWYEPELDTHRVEYLNAHGIRDLLRNSASRKPRAVLTQFLPPDDAAIPQNEAVVCMVSGQYFRCERRLNKHDLRDSSFTLNERGSVSESHGEGAHSDPLEVPGVMRVKLEESLRALCQQITYVMRRQVLVLKVCAKMRRGAVYLVRGETLTFFDEKAPRVLDPSVLFAAASPSSRAELRKRIRAVSRAQDARSSASPQGIAQVIIAELAAAKAHKHKRVAQRSRSDLRAVDSMYNIKIGTGASDYITLGRELRALQRTMSRSTMPGHEVAPAERDALFRGASFKQAATPAASTPPPPPPPRSSKKSTAASAPVPPLPPLFGSADSPEEEQQQKPGDAEETADTDDDDVGGVGDAKVEAAVMPSPHFSPAKLVSFAGAAVFAEDSDSAESSTEEFERKLEEINTRRISIDSASTGDFFIDDDEEGEGADEEDAFFDTANDQERRRNHQRHRRLHRDASMCRQKMTEKDRASLSARRWLRGDEPLLSADDIAAIDLLREDAERGLASKRLSQFRNSDGLLAPSLLFMKIKEDYGGGVGGGASKHNSSGDGDGGVNLAAASVRHQHQQQQRSDLDKFWDFRDRLLRAKVDAALRKDLLSNLRGC